MKNKKLKKFFAWLGVCVAFISLITLPYLFSRPVLAANVSHTNAETARRNVAVRMIAQNLAACFDNAQDNIDFSSNKSWDFGSSVYWKNTKMTVNYPKVLSGKTSQKDEKSTCKELITGWNGNWFVHLFGGKAGDFVGIDQGVVVPNNDVDEGGFWDSVGTMKTYLIGDGTAKNKGIGYTKESAGSSALAGYKCVYFHLTGYKNAFDNAGVPGPKSGSLDFISRETYCLPIKGGDGIDFNKDIKVYLEEDDNGMGLDREGSSRDKLSLDWMYMYSPKLERLSLDDGKEYFLLATIDGIYGYGYQINEPGTGRVRSIDDVMDGFFTVSNNETNSGCYTRVKYRSWFLASWNYYCSLTGGNEKKEDVKLTFDQFKSRFTNYINSIEVSDIWGEGSFKLFSTVTPKVLDPDSATAKFKKGDLNSFVTYFIDKSGEDIIKSGYKLTTEEQYMFYYDHLKDYFSKDVDNWLYNNASDAGDGIAIFWLDEVNNSFTKKYISMGSDTSKKACALTNDKKWDATCSTAHDWKYFAEQLGNFTEEELKTAFENVEMLDDDFSDAVDEQNGNPDSDCEKAASLGWLICPLIKGISGAVISTYDSAVEPLLKIDSGLFNNRSSNNSSVFSAWQIFQNIANIILVILLLIVIFSQLTGVGIDNYGIKKALPKLIVAAILINLSYIICQLAVDASNILGYAFRQMFENIAQGIPSTYTYDANNGVLPTIASGALSAGVIAGIIAAIYFGGWAIVLMALPALLGGLIVALFAVFFFFILLGARQAGVIVLAAIAPVAVVCYALPNTKKFFDKWLKIFSALLLLYPITGLLVGGGTFASTLLLNANPNGNFWYALTAMLVQVVPFFFIPTLLKGAFAALGGLGAAIAGFGSRMGNRLGGAAQRGLSNSQFQKENISRANFRASQRRMNRLQSQFNKKEKQGKSLSDRKLRRLDAAKREVADYRDQSNRAKLTAKEGWLSAADAKNAANNEIADQDLREFNRAGVAAGTVGEAAVNRELRSQRTANYANGSFIAAATKKGELANEREKGETMLYGNSRFAGAIEKNNALDLENKRKDTIQSGNAQILEAKRQEAANRRTAEMAQASAGIAATSFGVAKAEALNQKIATEAKNAVGVGTISSDVAMNQAMNAKTNVEVKNEVGEVKIDHDALKAKLQSQFNLATAENANYAEPITMENAEKIAINRKINAEVENEVGVNIIDKPAALAQAQSKRSAEALAAEISRMKVETNNYTPEIMIDQLKGLMTGGVISGSPEEIKAKALIKKLSTSSGFAQKELSQLIANESGSSGTQNIEFIAGFMQKDSDVAAAIAKKDNSVAQYLRDANAGRRIMTSGGVIASAGEVSYTDWLNARRAKGALDGSKGYEDVNNAQFVMNDVITNDIDYVSQSKAAVKRSVGLLSDDRIRRIVNNEQIQRSADGDILEVIRAEMSRRKLSSESSNPSKKRYSSFTDKDGNPIPLD